MAFPVVQHLAGGPNASPLSDLQSALAGTEGPATLTTWQFADGSGRKVIFTGSFDVVGGFVQDGTVTGFEVFDGAVKVLTGSGYALTDNAILKAHDAAIADDYTIFYPTFFSEVREVGSADADRMYGSTVKGKFLGEGGDDFLYGDIGNDVMRGGDGDDWVEGRGGADKLLGNAGADTFALTNVENLEAPTGIFAVHRFKDFDPGEDTIFLDVGRFAAIDPGPLDEAAFALGRKAKTPDVHVLFKRKSGELFYDEDGSGATKKVLVAEIEPGLKLKAHHFDVDFVA